MGEGLAFPHIVYLLNDFIIAFLKIGAKTNNSGKPTTQA
jgi:hypothetical protein